MTKVKKLATALLAAVMIMFAVALPSVSAQSISSSDDIIQTEPVGADVYQMVNDYKNGCYHPRIDDPTFNIPALFASNESDGFVSDSIYDVKLIDQHENMYEATRISFYSDLQTEDQNDLYDVIIMCRLVYQKISIGNGFDAYHISTVKGAVLQTTNTYIVDALYLSSTGSGTAYNSSGTYVGFKSEGKGYTKAYSSQPVTGTVYSMSSGLQYYYSPGVGGGGTGGFCKGIVSAAHTVDQHDLIASCGWV